MSEIASELGLSRKTVSAVINGPNSKRYVNAETARRVREHMERRGYVPSRSARQLRTNPERVVGILHMDSIYSHLVEATHLLAREFARSDSGSAVEIMVTPCERLKSSVQELLARRVTDLIWINASAGEEFRNPDIASYLSNTRTIIYNYVFESARGEDELLSRGIALVGVDRLEHARKLALFLKRLGHRVVAIPDIPRLDNLQSYFEVFEAAGLTVADYSSPFTVERMLKAMKKQGVTAVCFHGDSPACLALNDLRAAGVRVPEDLTVTGFDGMSRSYNRDLTTQSIPVEKMVAKVCELVEGREKVKRHCFDLELVKGQTHGLPRGV